MGGIGGLSGYDLPRPTNEVNYNVEFKTEERHRARLKVLTYATSIKEAKLFFSQLGLDDLTVPRDMLPLRKP